MAVPIVVRGVVTDETLDYYFLLKPGVYVDEIAEAVGIEGPTSEDDYSSKALTSVKELIRAGIITTVHILLKDSNSATKIKKSLHCALPKYATIATGLVGKTWPTGKGAGFTIDSIEFPTRITNRRY